MKYLLILLFPLYLFANLTYVSNHNKELSILESFDIEPSFIYDPIMNDMRTKNSSISKTKHFFKAMNDAYIFIPAIKNLLNKHDIPQEFLYLAMAESNFKPKAYSTKRASGLWQFMPLTGKLYNLNIDEYVDERRDPIKSTEAASKYLTSLHKRFGKWYLAAIAYNCGEGRLSRAIKRAGTDNLAVLLDKNKKYIPRESRIYIRKIMMMEHLSNSTDFILGHDADYLMNRGTTYTFAKVTVKGGTTLSNVADSVGMSYKELKSYNPHLRYGFVPPKKGTYDIYLPYGKHTIFEQNFDPNKDNGRFYVHSIKRGDSLYSIGKKYGVSYKIIKDFNNLKSNTLRINKKLVIPVLKPKTRQYTIKSGDTIGNISRKFNVTINSIMKINNKKNSQIIIGERLVIPYVY